MPGLFTHGFWIPKGHVSTQGCRIIQWHSSCPTNLRRVKMYLTTINVFLLLLLSPQCFPLFISILCAFFFLIHFHTPCFPLPLCSILELSIWKHIFINFIQERVKKGDLIIQYVPTNEQVADVLTKGLRYMDLTFSEILAILNWGFLVSIEGGYWVYVTHQQ